jgi:hypothetical protein
MPEVRGRGSFERSKDLHIIAYPSHLLALERRLRCVAQHCGLGALLFGGIIALTAVTALLALRRRVAAG